MGHIQDFECQLRELLEDGDTEALVKWAKDAVLKSYRNGLATRETSGKEGERNAQRYGKNKK